MDPVELARRTETIYHILKMPQNNRKIVCCAWSGIAANLLPEERTVASLFKLNIAQNCETSGIKPKSTEGRALKGIDVFIIDECSMLSVQVLHTIDSVLREWTNQMDVPSGGKTVLLGGDFRQVLPIPNKLISQDPYTCCLKQFPYFQKGGQATFRRYELSDNMRAEGASEKIKNFLLAVGEGRVPTDKDGCIEIPAELRSSGDLISEIFEDSYDDVDHLSTRAILCPNYEVKTFSTMMLTSRLVPSSLQRRFVLASSSSKPPSEKIREGTPEIDSLATERAKKLATEAEKRLAKEEMYMEKKASEAMDNMSKKQSKGILEQAREWISKKMDGK